MKDSVIYQEIFEEGMEKGIEKGRIGAARELLLELGAEKLGTPDAAVQSRLQMISDRNTLKALTIRALRGSITTWAELLASEA
jgi:predicted transposase YdaD